MQMQYAQKFTGTKRLDCLVLFFYQDALSLPSGAPPELEGELKRLADLKDFNGAAGKSQLLLPDKGGIPRLLCAGLGKRESIDRERLRRAAGHAAKQLSALSCENAGVLLPHDCGPSLNKQLAEVIGEGLLLGAYRFTPYQQPPAEKQKTLARVTLFDPQKTSSADSLRRGVSRGEAICLARTLGNHPPNYMTPTRLAEQARQVAKKRGLKIRVLEKKDLEKLGMEMLLGVARGSRQAPKFILMEHRPRGAKGTLAFVGKGITFDSGGISLKPGAAMDEMKFDMCGAAAVVGAMDVIGALKPAVNVVGVIPACENLPDGDALKPGDILKAYGGKHVEILNTDAEGRLILGDALAYVVDKFKPDAVVDLATLTGACVIALGHYATGAITNDEGLMRRVREAGAACGDVIWELPGFDEYGEGLKGKYADLQNIGPREGGTITAGLFLKHFVGEVPWVHLDIAGTAWGVKDIGHIPYAGATGVGVTLLLELAERW